MSILKRWVLLAIVVLFVVVPTWPWFHIGAGIEGLVLDAETGEPLEGVVVMARWQLESGWFESQPYRQLQLLEAVTDRRGRYSIPWWGPRVFVPWAHLNSSDPLLVFFKSGYRVVRKHNGYQARGEGRIIRRSEWDKQSISMRRFTGTGEMYVRHLGRSLFLVISGISSNDDSCALTSLPRLFRELRFNADKLASRGTYSSYGANSGYIRDLRKCPNARPFFVEYWR